MGYNIPSEYTKTPDLRGRTIQRIMTEGLFHMAYWEPASLHEAKYRHGCKTASCLAGNVVLAAKELKLRVSGIRPWYSIASQAQVIWQAQYGRNEATAISSGFYGGFSICPLEDITPEETVAFIYRCWRESSAHG